MPMDEKIIQIIPAPAKLFAVYSNEENPKREITSRIVCLALTDKGEVYAMDTDSTGFIDRSDNAGNFKGFVWR